MWKKSVVFYSLLLYWKKIEINHLIHIPAQNLSLAKIIWISGREGFLQRFSTGTVERKLMLLPKHS